MKWFKHDSNASTDAKIEKLIIKYGLEGYGLYFYCLELISNRIEKHNLTFELEHDAEIIGHRVGMHHEKVQEIMTYIVNLGLFENDSGRITCLKLATRLDQSMTSNPDFRKLVSNLRQKHDGIMTQSNDSHDTISTEQNRTEQNREDKKKTASSKSDDGAFDLFWSKCPKKVDKKKSRVAFNRLSKAKQLQAISDIQQRYSETEKQFIPNPTTYIHGERWNDELVAKPKKLFFPAKGDCNAWVKFASDHGIKTKAGESMYDFENRVRNTIEKNKGQ